MSNHISHGDTEDTEIVGYMVHSLSDLCACARPSLRILCPFAYYSDLILSSTNFAAYLCGQKR